MGKPSERPTSPPRGTPTASPRTRTALSPQHVPPHVSAFPQSLPISTHHLPSPPSHQTRPQPVRPNLPTAPVTPLNLKPPPMADRGQHQHQKHQSTLQQLAKGLTAVATGGSLLALSGLTMAGTVIALTAATPLMVVFSPVLVPAAIAVALIVTGFLAAGGLGVAALSVLAWMYKYVTGKQPVGADRIDQARARIAAKARDLKESAQQKVEQATS